VPVAAADISSGTGQNHSTRFAGFHGEAEGEICAARAAFQPPSVKSDPEPLHHGAFILSALRDEGSVLLGIKVLLRHVELAAHRRIGRVNNAALKASCSTRTTPGSMSLGPEMP
jgi:hypothetical protein